MKKILTILSILLISQTSLAATLTVDNLGDLMDSDPGNGICATEEATCTLRAAIDEARYLAGKDTIVFDSELSGTISVGSTLNNMNYDVEITGPSDPSQIVLDGGNSIQIISIFPLNNYQEFTISNLTFTNSSFSAIVLNGADYDSGTVILDNCIITNNHGTVGGAASIFSGGDITINNSEITNNTASEKGGALWMGNANSSFSISNSTFSGNSAAHGGGAIHNDFLGNIITIDGSTFYNNDGGDGQGGAISRGDTLITNSSIYNNTTTNANGGGIYSNERLRIVNSTIAYNQAINDGTTTYGGGIFNHTDGCYIYNSTILGNTADEGGDLFNYSWGSENTAMLIYNSIIAKDPSIEEATGPFCDDIDNSEGRVYTMGYNIIEDDSTCPSDGMEGTYITGDPLLGTLDDNGGRTKTFALLSNSPAVDAGNPTGCLNHLGAEITADQREETAPTDGNGDEVATCDLGSFEVNCGDGIIGGAEECDDGNDVDTDSCPSTCMNAVCGDGFVRTGVEGCDDGNDIDGDGCQADCSLPNCGDEIVDDGEDCDDGNDDNTDSCIDTCANASCGDGYTQAGVEECDDGNSVNTDSCLETCVSATCGDGYIQTGIEECDGGDSCSDECTTIEETPEPTGTDTSGTGTETGSTTTAASPASGGCSLIIK